MLAFTNNQRSKEQDTTLTYQTYNANYTKSGRIHNK